MNRAYLKDLAERVAATFAATFLAVWTAPILSADSPSGVWQAISDLSIVQKAALAGAAAVVSLAKGVLARYVGSPDTASLAR